MASSGSTPIRVSASTILTGALLTLVSSDVAAQSAEVRVDPTPVFTVGQDLGSTEFFGSIRDAIRLPDGRFVVADAQARELWFIAADGTVLVRAGGEGEGPGEFDQVTAGMFSRSDGTIAIWDSGLGRMTLLDQRAGEPVESFRPESPPAGSVGGTPMILVGGTPTGDFILGFLSFGMREIDGLTPDQFDFVQYDPRGNFVRALGEDTGFLRILSGPTSYRGPHPFTPEGRWDSGNGLIVFANGLLPEFSRFDVGSGTISRVSFDAGGSLITRDEAWAEITPVLEAEDSRMSAGALELDRSIGHVPAFSEVLVGPDSTVWVKRYDPATDALMGSSEFGGGTWDILSSAGQPLGTFAAPPRFLPFGADDQLVWGLATDELGTPYFAVYRRTP